MYVPRRLRAALERVLATFPAAIVTGPRQSGKTTFLREELADRAEYVSFDSPLESSFARDDPNGFLDRFGDRPVILDEIQYVPGILRYLKLRIDEHRDRRGRWILTGSQRFHLMRDLSESLAGRIAVLELLPFSLLEHPPAGDDALVRAIWLGAYPEPSLEPSLRDDWLRAYTETYLRRDVRDLMNVRDLDSFTDFLGACAARHGQLPNHASVSRDCGISKPTVKSWAGILEASHVAFRLRPFHNNLGKRLVKSAKLYFLDAALVCYLTRQPSGEAALSGAMGGALFEGLVVAEAVKVFANLGRDADLWFWRSHDGLEVDLIVQTPEGLAPVEIKKTATPNPGHLRPLERFKELAGIPEATGLLVCRVAERTPLPHGNLALPWDEFPAWLESRLVGAPEDVVVGRDDVEASIRMLRPRYGGMLEDLAE